MGAQNFIFVPKFSQNERFSAKKCALLGVNFRKRTTFLVNFPSVCCHDTIDLHPQLPVHTTLRRYTEVGET